MSAVVEEKLKDGELREIEVYMAKRRCRKYLKQFELRGFPARAAKGKLGVTLSKYCSSASAQVRCFWWWSECA